VLRLVEFHRRVDLLACGGLLARHRQDQADLDGFLRGSTGRAERQSRGGERDFTSQHCFPPKHFLLANP
jgi:hypothetical protein